jgi:hypothetical protein
MEGAFILIVVILIFGFIVAILLRQSEVEIWIEKHRRGGSKGLSASPPVSEKHEELIFKGQENTEEGSRNASEAISKPTANDVTESLNRIVQLHADGLLTDNEFNALKAKLISRENTPEERHPAGKKAVKWRWVTVGILALLLVAALKYQATESNLKVSATVQGLEITNVGTTPVRILDVVVNERDDCSTIGLTSNTFSKDYLHKIWVADGTFMYIGEKDGSLFEIGTNRKLSVEPRILKIGESAYWVPRCLTNYVRVSVTTDGGTTTYSFK